MLKGDTVMHVKSFRRGIVFQSYKTQVSVIPGVVFRNPSIFLPIPTNKTDFIHAKCILLEKYKN
jgi:hypothetical protein